MFTMNQPGKLPGIHQESALSQPSNVLLLRREYRPIEACDDAR